MQLGFFFCFVPVYVVIVLWSKYLFKYHHEYSVEPNFGCFFFFYHKKANNIAAKTNTSVATWAAKA